MNICATATAEGMRIFLSIAFIPSYDDQPTFHAKYEDALHLMLLKCICFSSFG